MVALMCEGGHLFLLLTEQDVNDVRGGGRTKYVDETVIRGAHVRMVSVSVYSTQEAIYGMVRAAGHGVLLEGAVSSPEPTPEQTVCLGCRGNMDASTVLDGKCIACWRESAKGRA